MYYPRSGESLKSPIRMRFREWICVRKNQGKLIQNFILCTYMYRNSNQMTPLILCSHISSQLLKCTEIEYLVTSLVQHRNSIPSLVRHRNSIPGNDQIKKRELTSSSAFLTNSRTSWFLPSLTCQYYNCSQLSNAPVPS